MSVTSVHRACAGVLLLAAACGGDPCAPFRCGDFSDPSPDAGMPGDASPDAVSDAKSDAPLDAVVNGCNDLVDTAPVVTLVHSTMSPPTATGGAIAPGLYFQTAGTRYDGLTGVYGTGRQVMRFSGGNFDQLLNAGSDDSRYSGTWSAKDVTLTMTSTCPQKGEPTSFGYTASPSEVRLYITEGQAVLEVVFSKQ